MTPCLIPSISGTVAFRKGCGIYPDTGNTSKAGHMPVAAPCFGRAISRVLVIFTWGIAGQRLLAGFVIACNTPGVFLVTGKLFIF
jgi:hypothetical protein